MSDENVIHLPREQQRLSVNINTQTADALRTYCDKHSVEVTEAVRRLINVGAFILAGVDEGRSVQFRGRGVDQRITFDF